MGAFFGLILIGMGCGEYRAIQILLYDAAFTIFGISMGIDISERAHRSPR
jgi:hypothetical protein